MRTWFGYWLLLAMVRVTVVTGQTNEPGATSATGTATKGDAKIHGAIEKLIIEPKEIGLDAQFSIDGMVINVKSPVKIIANDNEMTVTSTEFRDKNLRFAGLGMRSWMTVTYRITEEDDKRVTLTVMEFESAKQARRFWVGQAPTGEEDEAKQDLELKGSLFCKLLHGSILLSIDWPEPRTPGVDKLVSAYKAKLLTF